MSHEVQATNCARKQAQLEKLDLTNFNYGAG